MVKTLAVTASIPEDRTVHLTLPDDVPVGPAEIVLVVVPRGQAISKTLGDLAQSEFFGMWRDRQDMEDSVEFARKLREEAWSRSA